MVIRAGVIGDPVAQSLSPRIYNHWFDAVGMAGRYEAVHCEADRFEETVRRLMAEGWQGLNVTIPHKTRAADLADYRNPEVEQIGAANLLLFRDGKIIADNTDRRGFARSRLNPQYVHYQATQGRARKAVVLGAGGAAGPIVLDLWGLPEIVVTNRTFQKAERLADRFDEHVRSVRWEDRNLEVQGADILVNTTSLGMKGQPPLEVDLSGLNPGALVVDIVYAPLRTQLLQEAEKLGFFTANGLTMLVYQAVPSFKAYTGLRPPSPEKILQILTRELS
ncbi:shikimate dehydrogenase [Parvularcula maris]|uniref:Shikimate dehydrogenase (NADP(+)) n=1 Tax=Parvularcula maris TaxID=2965077 RepID=A0A9X2RGC4_9PROT|nr:shikimate dehydrogenase [Parvularcula maris]